MIATWKWFETWLESLTNDFEEREILYKLINELFKHISSQEKKVLGLDYNLARVGESFSTLKEEIKELKRHMKAKKKAVNPGSHYSVSKNKCAMLAVTPKMAS